MALGALLKHASDPAETLAELVANLPAYRPGKKGGEPVLLPPGFLAGVVWMKPGFVALPRSTMHPFRLERDGVRFEDALFYVDDIRSLLEPMHAAIRQAVTTYKDECTGNGTTPSANNFVEWCHNAGVPGRREHLRDAFSNEFGRRERGRPRKTQK